MDKQRIVVSNNSKTVETEHEGAWTIARVEASNGLKPGVYKLHEALDVARNSKQQIDGTILHADTRRVYQSVGSEQIVAYDRSAFSKAPPIGQHVTVDYDYGRAWVVERSLGAER